MFFRKDNRPGINGGERSGIPSLVSVDLHVRGDVVSLSELLINGTVEGEVIAQNLTIGEKAEITGSVLGAEVAVRGRVIGNIRAKKLHLHASAHVEGDLEHESLSVEAGAHLDGSCRHVEEGINLPPIIQERLSRKTPRLPPPQERIIKNTSEIATEQKRKSADATAKESATGGNIGDRGNLRNDKPVSPVDPLSSF